MPQYPGYVMRQSLIDELQKKEREYKLKANDIYRQYEIKGLDEKSKAAFLEKYYLILGKIHNLREISEWAREHSAPSLKIGQC